MTSATHNMGNRLNFAQLNAYAMQYGAVLGGWMIALLALWYASLRVDALSWGVALMWVGSPVLAWYLTVRCRHDIGAESPFGFSKAYLHTLAMGVYASLVVAAFVYLYLAFLDGGSVWARYEAYLNRPDVAEQLQASGLLEQLAPVTGQPTAEAFVNSLRAIPAATYALATIYMNLFVAPVVSVPVALFAKARR